jgi:hypothetical protein
VAARKKTTSKAKAPVESHEPTAAELRATRVAALTAAFTALGAREPERWAASHIDHGLDQLGRFVLLRALWEQVIDQPSLRAWREQGGEGSALINQLLATGVDEASLLAFGRHMQTQLLVDICQILDDPNDNDEGIRWGLWRMDKRGMPLWQLPDLRLDVLEVDPADDE